MTLPPDPIQAMPTYELAKAAFEAQPSIRVLFDNGAGNASNPGWPYPAFEQSFASFPIPGTTARSWYLAPDGALADAPASGTRADAFTWDADARPLTNFTGDTGAGDNGLWTATPPYQWSQDPARQRRRLRDRAAECGHDRSRRRPGGPLGTVLRAQRRPAGDDQRGPAGRQGDLRTEWLGANQSASTRRGQEHGARAGSQPARGGLRADARRPVRAGHGPALLPGARLSRRLAHPRQGLGAQRRPADLVVRRDRARRNGGDRDRLRRRDAVPPRLPLVPGVDVPDQLPPCPGLRGEPCRDYVPFENDTSVLDGYPRPKGATPLFAPLVPAYKSCSAPNGSHGAPLSFPSCNPPDLESQFLTVGTPDNNGKGARSIGSVLFKVMLGDEETSEDEADLQITVSLTDVRRQADLDDYSGELEANPTLQVTDRQSGTAGDEPGTVNDIAFPVTVPCAGTADTMVGANCAITTTVDSVLPGTVSEGTRAIWELGQLEVFDGGSDGLAATDDNTVFARQGVFVP